MARFMTQTIAAPSPQVLDAVLDAAAEIGLEAPRPDRRAGDIRLRGPVGRTAGSQRLSVSVTDNGFGGSTLYVSWDDRFSSRVSGHRMANRLCKSTRRLLS